MSGSSQRSAADSAEPGRRPASRCDAVIVGAGFAGLYMLYRLRQLGLTYRVFETADEVGGTWYWNRYPGARVDGDSLSYSFGFDEELQQEWHWSEMFSPQPELLRYASHVADRFDLRKDIEFNTTVTGARWLDSEQRWLVETDRGDQVSARFLITAVGCLSATNVPVFAGSDRFRGTAYHAARWPRDGVDLSGQRVGVIGTGATGIQVVPAIAGTVAHLYVFQRTAHFAIPNNNRPMEPDRERAWKATYAEHRAAARVAQNGHDFRHFGVPRGDMLTVPPAERREIFERAWSSPAPALILAFNNIRTSLEANEVLGDFIRDKIRSIVKDPATAELLCPTYPIGSRRIPLESGYYETFNRDNVTLVDVKSNPVVELTETGLRTTAGDFDLDTIIFATGFDAITGPLLRMNIVGAGGLSLAEKWHEGPRSYLGLMTAGFPNLFTITGPGSPSVLSNVITAIEQHVEWISGALGYLCKKGFEKVEASIEAEDNWVSRVNELAEQTVFIHGGSWYLGANIPGKPRVFMPYVGGMGSYRATCDEVADRQYEGFKLS